MNIYLECVNIFINVACIVLNYQNMFLHCIRFFENIHIHFLKCVTFIKCHGFLVLSTVFFTVTIKNDNALTFLKKSIKRLLEYMHLEYIFKI